MLVKSAAEKKRLFEVLNRFPRARVLVVGDFILDQFIWGTVDRISPEAPVPVVHVTRESYMPGGALNAANNIRTLGGSVYPCGVVGRDREGRMLLSVLRREGIDTGGIVYDAGRPTSIKTRVIAHSQQVVRFDREKSENISTGDRRNILKFIRHKMPQTDVIILEDYGKGVIQADLLREITALARRFKKPVLVDPKEKNFDYYTGVTAVTPNRKEAYSAYGPFRGGVKPSLDEVGRALLKKWRCEAVLITLGEDGMVLYEKTGGKTQIPTTAQEVYDVSGAGDTVIGTLALALAAGARMREAAVLSNLAAGIVVAKLGTATVLPAELRTVIEQQGARG